MTSFGKWLQLRLTDDVHKGSTT